MLFEDKNGLYAWELGLIECYDPFHNATYR
jgi:hypothetical protein